MPQIDSTFYIFIITALAGLVLGGILGWAWFWAGSLKSRSKMQVAAISLHNEIHRLKPIPSDAVHYSEILLEQLKVEKYYQE